MEKKSTDNSGGLEFEIEVDKLLLPASIIISAIIISVPISLALYFGLREASLGGGNVVMAAECDEASPYSDACLNVHAQEIGLNVDEFAQCVDNGEFDAQVDEDLAYGEEVGVQGTPSVYIGENQGEQMRGFSVGAGVSLDQVDQLVQIISDSGIDAAAEEWKQIQLGDLDAYEQQLLNFYTEQGQTGEALENSVAAGLSERRNEIESSVSVQDLVYGEAAQKGSANASVAIMEFSDYECPFCERFAQGVGKQINDNYVEPGQILFIYKEFPLESIHPSARKLANAALCAKKLGGDEKYFEMHDKIFKVE